MNWLTLMEFLFLRWPRISSVCRYHNLTLSTFVTYVCNENNTTGATCRSGTTCPSEAHEFAPSIALSWCDSSFSCLITCLRVFCSWCCPLQFLCKTDVRYRFDSHMFVQYRFDSHLFVRYRFDSHLFVRYRFDSHLFVRYRFNSPLFCRKFMFY